MSKRRKAPQLQAPGRGRELSELRRRARRWGHRPGRGNTRRAAIERESDR